MRLLNSPLQIKSFLIPQSPNLFLKAVLYHHMLFIASQVLASSYWYGAAELEAFEMLNSKVLNAKLSTIELGYRDFTWEIKHRFKHFQALYQEVLIVKVLLKPPPLSNPHGRIANLLTFCHSYMQHTEPTPAQRRRLVQKSHETLSQQKDKIDFNEMKRLLNWLPSIICECSFLSGGFSVSAHSHFSQFSSSEKHRMFSQKVEIHLYNEATEGFQNTASSQMKPSTMWGHIWSVGNKRE